MSDIEKKLEETRKMLAELSINMEAFTSQESVVNHKIRDENRRLQELMEERTSINNAAAHIRRELANAKRMLDEQERELATQKANERAAAELARQNAAFNDALLKYEWGGKAKPHQIDGAKRLAIAHRAILGDKRGLGKTLTSIAFADLVGARKILAVVPNDVRGNFEREIRFWAPHREAVNIGDMSKIQRNALLNVFKDLPDLFVVINYEAWVKDNSLIQRLIECKFDTVIADEAHMMKEMSTSAFRGVKAIMHAENACPICGSSNFQGDYWSTEQRAHIKRCYDCHAEQDKFGDFCSVKNILPMTGTPILNKPQDIFPLLHLVNPILFDDKKRFLNMYCTMNWEGKWVFKDGGAAMLATKLSGMYIARDRYQAGVEIPKQEVQVHDIEFDPLRYPEQYQAYQILSKKAALVLDDMLSESEDKSVMPILYMIALITRQRQMAVWPAGIEFRHPKTKALLMKTDITESAKLDYIIDREGNGLAAQLIQDEQERVVLFSQFKQPLIELERRLTSAGIRVVRYDGDTPHSLRQEIQIDFDRKYQTPEKPYKWDIVLGHYKTGGTGINLNAATQMIILDEEWNPGKVDQAYGRIDRMGQDEETTVHVLRLEKTVDNWMAKLIQSKADMIAGFETQVDLQQELLKILQEGGKE